MTRPKEIVLFEQIIFGTLLLGVLKTYLAWDQLVALGSLAVILGGLIIVGAIMVGLTLLVSRRRNNYAKWAMLLLFVLGLPAFATILRNGFPVGSTLINVAQIAGQFLAYVLLFTPAARQWLKGEPSPA